MLEGAGEREERERNAQAQNNFAHCFGSWTAWLSLFLYKGVSYVS